MSFVVVVVVTGAGAAGLPTAPQLAESVVA